jgi:hypothetical protein
MCCGTHHLSGTAPNGYDYGPRAEDDRLRCQCGPSWDAPWCIRRATQEDQLCDFCRARAGGVRLKAM